MGRVAKGLHPSHGGGSPAPSLLPHQRGAAPYHQSQRGMMSVPRGVMSMQRIPKLRTGTEGAGAMKRACGVQIASKHVAEDDLVEDFFQGIHPLPPSCSGALASAAGQLWRCRTESSDISLPYDVLHGDVGRQLLRNKRTAIAGPPHYPPNFVLSNLKRGFLAKASSGASSDCLETSVMSSLC